MRKNAAQRGHTRGVAGSSFRNANTWAGAATPTMPTTTLAMIPSQTSRRNHWSAPPSAECAVVAVDIERS